MERLFTNATAAADSKVIGGDSGVVNTGVLAVRVASSSPTFTLKVKSRILGRGQKDALDNDASDFDHYLAVENRTTGALVAGSTGITAAGLYSVDVSGVEAIAELASISGGGITVDWVPLRG